MIALVNRIRSRAKQLQDAWKHAWKPIGLILSVLSGIGSFREFRHRSGPYFFRSLALSALAIAILFTVPIESTRLFARRVVAFLMDLLLFGLGTIGLVSLLFEVGVVRPSAVTSMVIVWSWVLLFVLLDWAFAGTPGKKIMGLRLKGARAGGPALLGCLARNLLTFVVPLSVAGRILSIATQSKAAESAEWGIAVAILSFCPLSIIFFHGQSLPDLLVGITVLPKKSHEGQPSALRSKRNSLLFVLTSLLTGVAYGFTPSIDSGVMGNQLQFPMKFAYVSQPEAQMAAGLWPYIQAGTPEGFLQDMRVSTSIGNLPGLPGEDPLAGTACEQSYKAKRSYKIVRLQIDPVAPIIVVTSLYANMLHATDRFEGRPGVMVIELSRRRSFGVFNLELPEDYVICFAGSGTAPENNLVATSRSLQMEGSFNELSALFLGNLGPYSYVEKVPVYPWQNRGRVAAP
jgi:hypothetical protein